MPPLEFLGRATGSLGLFLLVLAALTSARLPGVDPRLGGLTKVWKIHHLLGAASFLLLMAHPLLLSFASARLSLQAAAAVLFPGSPVGWLALAAMATFLAPTFSFFGPPEYQRWKSLHALSGVALVAGVAHAGKPIWAVIAGVTALAFAYRLFAARKSFTVVRVEPVGRGTVELTLKPDGFPLVYREGQFIYLTPLDPGLEAGRGEEHPYTVSSARGEPAVRVVIKNLGDASRALQTTAVGSKALVEGPFGRFFPVGAPPARELWIAGGIGLTPFLSRARSLTPAAPVDIRLIYCVQDESRAHFLPELEAIAARIPGYKLTTHYFGREGPLNAAFLRACCPDYAEREAFVCGPPPLIEGARALIRRGRLHTEEFTWL